MKKMAKLLALAAMIAAMMALLAGCGYQTIYDGETGVRIRDGIVDENYLTPNRYAMEEDGRTQIVVVNNKIQTAYYGNLIEGQSKDDVIVNASGYEISYQIGAGEKSVWLVKNVSDWQNNLIPSSLVANALRDALLGVEAKNVTKRIYVEPLFKEILQQRIDEHIGYHNGEDSTLVVIRSVSIGNLSPEEDYDRELSRGATLVKKAENDNLEYETSLSNADKQIELAKREAESLTAGWEELSEKFTPEVAAYYIIQKWDGQCTPGSPIEQLIEYYVGEALANDSD